MTHYDITTVRLSLMCLIVGTNTKNGSHLQSARSESTCQDHVKDLSPSFHLPLRNLPTTNNSSLSFSTNCTLQATETVQPALVPLSDQSPSLQTHTATTVPLSNQPPTLSDSTGSDSDDELPLTDRLTNRSRHLSGVGQLFTHEEHCLATLSPSTNVFNLDAGKVSGDRVHPLLEDSDDDMALFTRVRKNSADQDDDSRHPPLTPVRPAHECGVLQSTGLSPEMKGVLLESPFPENTLTVTSGHEQTGSRSAPIVID